MSGEAYGDVLHDAARGAANGAFAGRDDAPGLVRNIAVHEVGEEAEDVARADAAEEIANHVADSGAPRRGWTEKERAYDRDCIGGAQLSDTRN